MSPHIPLYQLEAFAGRQGAPAAVYFPDYGKAKPTIPLDRPYRGDYYKISICLGGGAELKADLTTYRIARNSLILATPEVVKQWLRVTDDYETLSVFFTKDFISTNNAATGKLRFLVAPTAYVLHLSDPAAARIAASFRFLQQKYHQPGRQRENIVKSIITSLLYELGDLYDEQPGTHPAGTDRARVLTAAFRELVQQHCPAERSVGYYAAALCITAKHLTEQVKQATGRTARDWIAEAVVLEAKMLLQNPALTIKEVAASLLFTDQFAFSRFFSKAAGCSPTAYRQAR